MRKFSFKARDDAAGETLVDVTECPMCGRFRESVDMDCKRWRYCHKDRIRWCVGDNREPSGCSSISAEQWHAIVDRINEYRVVEVTESGRLKDTSGALASDRGADRESDEDGDASVLLTPDIRQRLPKLYTTENDDDPVVQVKWFSPWMNWTWYVTEFDTEDTCFGLVEGHATEWGYFSLKELQAARGPGGVCLVERDLYFSPTRISMVETRRR